MRDFEGRFPDDMIVEAVGSEWTTRAQIIQRLKLAGLDIGDRNFRHWVEFWNRKYCDMDTDIYIAHGPRGYKATMDMDEIKDSVADLRCRAMDMLKKYSDTRKALGRRLQTRLFEE